MGSGDGSEFRRDRKNWNFVPLNSNRKGANMVNRIENPHKGDSLSEHAYYGRQWESPQGMKNMPAGINAESEFQNSTMKDK